MLRFERFFAVYVALAPNVVLAWGADAHRLIAELAEQQLSAPAKVEATRLLSQEPGATLSSVAAWADETRSPGSAPLHYVNLPEEDCAYLRQRDCPNGQCVIEALKTQLALLQSRATDQERLKAMKWVIHLVGDIHQPLHVGLASDRGGNRFQVRAFGRGSNLHAVWDSELIKRRPGGKSKLLLDAATPVKPPSPASNVASWASESCEVSRRTGFYPPDRWVGYEYAEHWDAELVKRLSQAGARLADALNHALSAR